MRGRRVHWEVPWQQGSHENPPSRTVRAGGRSAGGEWAHRVAAARAARGCYGGGGGGGAARGLREIQEKVLQMGSAQVQMAPSRKGGRGFAPPCLHGGAFRVLRV